MSAKEIVKEIRENGGLDMSYIRFSSKKEGVSTRKYIAGYIKSSYNCHGNTANAVARLI